MVDFVACNNIQNKEQFNQFSQNARYLNKREWMKTKVINKGEFALAWSSVECGDDHFAQDTKGDFFLLLGTASYRNKPIHGNIAQDVLKFSLDEIIQELRLFEGRYCIVLVKGKDLIVSESTLGTITVYYSKEGDQTYFSTSQQILNVFSPKELDVNGLKQRCLYYCNFVSTLLKGVVTMPHDSFIKVSEGNKLVTTSFDRIKANKEPLVTSYSEAADFCQEKVNAAFKAQLSCEQKPVSLMLSGGRDSRYISQLTLENIGSENVNHITCGDFKDIEIRVAQNYTKYFGYNHEVVNPAPLNSDDILDFVWQCEDLNIVMMIDNDLVPHLRRNQSVILETNSPELFFGHIERGYGPYDKINYNFTWNVNSCVKAKDIVHGEEICELTLAESDVLIDRLDEDINSFTKTALFDLTVLQRNWCFHMHRAYDQAHPTYNIFDSSHMIDVFQRIPKEMLQDYKLYDEIVHRFYPDAFHMATTREITPSKIYQAVRRSIGNAKYMLDAFNMPGPLGSLIEQSRPNISVFIKENTHYLEGVFSDEFIEKLLREIDKNFLYNRIGKLPTLINQRDYLIDYDILAACFVIAFQLNLKKPRSYGEVTSLTNMGS
ncbi:hypothetical protein RYZ26_18635 [Terasakiella sp. A23]|uniref:hypothetical protein n=1 Tax=Terasakiella sp. FCG-A23 TaxID=3080561 RepID=UPI002955CBD1|nr:hypothetical protein [Terasakiella sp. A23]MDV7341624.1 hypothetical protein [Terasakiella sp. A23]